MDLASFVRPIPQLRQKRLSANGMGNSTYHEPEDLGPDQDARDASIPGRKYFVYVLETDFGHYVGHTARLNQRIDEHIRGETPTTRGSNPKLAWSSRPLQTRSDAAKFEAALKSLCDQRSPRFTEYTGLESEPFKESELSRIWSRLVRDLKTIQMERRHRYPNNVSPENRGIDIKKSLAWFTVVLILAFVVGYILGFGDAQTTLNSFAKAGMILVIGVVCFAVYWVRRYVGRAIVAAVRGRLLTGPVVGHRRNSWIAIVLASLLGVATGGLLGYNLGLSTAHGLTEFFAMIGVTVFLTVLLAIAGYVIVKWQSNQPRRGRQSNGPRRRRQSRRRW